MRERWMLMVPGEAAPAKCTHPWLCAGDLGSSQSTSLFFGHPRPVEVQGARFQFLLLLNQILRRCELLRRTLFSVFGRSAEKGSVARRLQG